MEGHTASRNDSFCDGKFCFVHLIFRFLGFGHFGDDVKEIRKHYVIFVYILQGKMGKTEKNG